MYIAMNRFRVAKGSEADFEALWLGRDSHLGGVPGFVEFHLLKGPSARTTCSTPRTRSGAPSRISRPGPARRRSALRTGKLAAGSRSISTTRSSRASR